MSKLNLCRTFDSKLAPAFDAATNLAYMVHQLENIDPIMHKPITGVTWGRDIKLRTGIVMSDEFTSFHRINYGSSSTLKQGGIPWVTQDTNAIPAVSISGEKITTPMRLAAQIITYTKMELEKAQKLGIQLETEKLNALHMAYQLGIDKMVYVGDTDLDTTEHKCRGLVNRTDVTSLSASNFDEMDMDTLLETINNAIEKVWESTAYKIVPNHIILPPAILAKLATTKYGTNADRTAFRYLVENNLSKAAGGVDPQFVSSRWATKLANGQSDRIVAYVNDLDYIRYSMVPIRREESYHDQAFRYNTPYLWALGEVEIVYPETIVYVDGAEPTKETPAVSDGD